jgi:tetratricopeptide (TPR) repeat protein
MVVMDSFSSTLQIRRWLAAAILFGTASVASAGPGFIESSRVSGAASGTEATANIEVRFNCKAEYLRHEPHSGGDRLRIYLDPTGICNGVAPTVAESRSRLRPFNADSAHLIDLEYDGDSAGEPVLTLSFSETVDFEVDMSSIAFGLVVHVRPPTEPVTATAVAAVSPTVKHRQVVRPKEEAPDLVINLASFRRIPTVADAPGLRLRADQRLYYSEVIVDGTTWYRLRLGNYKKTDDATTALTALKTTFPDAWIDQANTSEDITELTVPTSEVVNMPIESPESADAPNPKVDSLMEDARKSIVAGDTSKAIQIYTKVLQLPGHNRQPEAQELLALAREKKGQMAHAKAEYRRYLSLYPEHEGAARVSQRLAVLLAGDRRTNQPMVASGPQSVRREPKRSDWKLQTYFSQYYRRDANQLNDQDETISQSALYSDVNVDARRRGERFDFSSRLSAGYRNDFLDGGIGSGDSLRISYAYADIADASTGLRGRIGRQSRNTGGVLGRFDGLNLGYQISERVLFNTVFGRPAYSSSDGIDSSRSFYGASVNYGPILENLDLGMFYIAQDVEGIQDRQAVGAEFRYFGTSQNLWGMVDYDIAYNELASAFLQGSWRLPSRLSIHATVDRRGSPFLSASNALIGQPVSSFAELAVIFSEDELRQLGRDRTALATTYTVGLSVPLNPKLQINADASQSTVDGTPASGGVLATEDMIYKYYSGSLVASSFFKEGDVSIISARFSDSGTARVISLTFDSRYPIGRAWRVNSRLRVDRRQRMLESGYEWLYTPGIRLQHRRSQKFRIELEAGKQFSQRQSFGTDLDRESYYINLGYQLFF